MQAKGLYIARTDIGDTHLLGVARKIEAQVLALTRALGPVDTWRLRGLTVEQNGAVAFRQRPGPLARQRLHAIDFYRAILRAGVEADYVYIRYQRCTPVFLLFLAILKWQDRDRPIVVEIPTFPYASEAITPREKVLGFVDKLTRRTMARFVNRIVTFSGRTEIFGIPTIQTQNGVFLEDITLVNPEPRQGGSEALRLVAVANVSFYHGYDRIIMGIYFHNQQHPDSKVTFDVIGGGRDIERLKDLSARFGLEQCVRFLGPMQGQVLDQQMEHYDLAVSSIGMHRVVAETSDLKSREYCARGIPFILANIDHDFPPSFEFSFTAPMDDSPVDVSAALEFLRQLRSSRPNYREEMRQFAEERLTWTAKMAPVVSALEDLLTPDA